MIHLPRLTKASFYYAGNHRTGTVLSLLSCPALQSIELCFLDNVSPMIEELHRQSLTLLPLRHLRIESCYLNEMKLARFLRRVPSLTSLELVDIEDSSPSLLKVSNHPGSERCITSGLMLIISHRTSRLPQLPRHGSARS